MLPGVLHAVPAGSGVARGLGGGAARAAVRPGQKQAQQRQRQGPQTDRQAAQEARVQEGSDGELFPYIHVEALGDASTCFGLCVCMWGPLGGSRARCHSGDKMSAEARHVYCNYLCTSHVLPRRADGILSRCVREPVSSAREAAEGRKALHRRSTRDTQRNVVGRR